MNQAYLEEVQSSLNLELEFEVTRRARLDSCFAVSELATLSFAAVGGAITQLISGLNSSTETAPVSVDQKLACLWFAQSIYPIDWELPPIWDPLAGDYSTKDGWIKLHTNLARHRAAVLEVLDCKEVRDHVASAIKQLSSDELESAIVKAGGVAAAFRSAEEWQNHPQGQSVAKEPLIHWSAPKKIESPFIPSSKSTPLAGLKVLDLTRILAGPVATRTLAGFGASVLRIDPPKWDEPFVVPDITLGKRCAQLQLNTQEGRNRFEALLQEADMLVHGYRPGALEALGYDETRRRELSPNLIEVTLDAYGWTGPWSQRRGFDSLVQMSSGIAHTAMQWKKKDKPISLPVPALDHATGYLMAAAAIRAINSASEKGKFSNARLSLVRTAELLMSSTESDASNFELKAEASDFAAQVEQTPWGKAKRLKPALKLSGTTMAWKRAANNLGSSQATWLDSK